MYVLDIYVLPDNQIPVFAIILRICYQSNLLASWSIYFFVYLCMYVLDIYVLPVHKIPVFNVILRNSEQKNLH